VTAEVKSWGAWLMRKVSDGSVAQLEAKQSELAQLEKQFGDLRSQIENLNNKINQTDFGAWQQTRNQEVQSRELAVAHRNFQAQVVQLTEKNGPCDFWKKVLQGQKIAQARLEREKIQESVRPEKGSRHEQKEAK